MDDPEVTTEPQHDAKFLFLAAGCLLGMLAMWALHLYLQPPRPVFQLNPPPMAYLHTDEYGPVRADLKGVCVENCGTFRVWDGADESDAPNMWNTTGTTTSIQLNDPNRRPNTPR